MDNKNNQNDNPNKKKNIKSAITCWSFVLELLLSLLL